MHDKENYYIEKFDSIKNGYNSGFGSQGCSGRIISSEENKKKLKTRADNMPFFMVSYKNQPSVNIVTNNYKRASDFTGLSIGSVRKKLRNNRKCNMFNYQYLDGGDLSQ
jgi:hypothetical protein